MVLLVGNYAPDRLQSMERFGSMILQGLAAAGIAAEMITPRPVFGTFRAAGPLVGKWLAYIDKFLLFRLQLRRRLQRGDVSLVHICDHSNAMYVRWCRAQPVVVTCHDLLAVRGALGEATDCPASPTGKILQHWVLAGLRAANAVCCVSNATRADAERLLPAESKPRLRVIVLGLNFPFRPHAVEETDARLRGLPEIDLNRPFVLHVGSSMRRKNREGVLRIFARTASDWNAQLVFAGAPLTAEQRALAESLGISTRIVEIVQPDNATLQALYNGAFAFIFPSRFEGLGWPIAEAQACGCPVLCGDNAPLPEVAGAAGLIHPLEDEAGFAADLLRLREPGERERWRAAGLRNAERFSPSCMIDKYLALYRELAPQL